MQLVTNYSLVAWLTGAASVAYAVTFADLNLTTDEVASEPCIGRLTQTVPTVILAGPDVSGVLRQVTGMNFSNPENADVTLNIGLVIDDDDPVHLAAHAMRDKPILTWSRELGWGPSGIGYVLPESITSLPALAEDMRQEFLNPLALPGGLVLVPTEAEIGATVAVTASVPSLTKNPVSHSIGKGAAQPVALQPGDRSQVFANISVTTDFHYSGQNALTVLPQFDATIYFRRRRYWGARGLVPNAAQIRAEFASELTNASTMSLKEIDATGNQRLYLVLPKGDYPQVPSHVLLGGWPVSIADNFTATTVTPANGGAGTEPCWLIQSNIVYDTILKVSLP